MQPDHLGSPRAVIEAARNLPVWTRDLKGETFGGTAPQQDSDGDGIPFVLDMRFPGGSGMTRPPRSIRATPGTTSLVRDATSRVIRLVCTDLD